MELKKTKTQLVEELEQLRRRVAELETLHDRRGRMEAPREGEESYRALLAIISDLGYAIRVEPDGGLALEWTTRTPDAASGFSPQALEGAVARGEWAALVHPDDLHIAQEQLESCLSGQPSAAEFRTVAESGETRWVRNCVSPEWDDSAGRIVRLFGATQDITPHKQLEEERTRLQIAEREQRELAKTLCEVTSTLGASLDRDQVLEHILEQLARVVDCDSASVMLVSDDVLDIAAHRGYPPEEQRLAPVEIETLPHVRAVLEERLPIIIPDTSADARWRKVPGSEHIRCWLGIPLMARDRVIGVLNLDKDQVGFFTQRDAEVAAVLADQAAIAIQNTRLYEQVRAGRQRLQALSHKLMEVQENERRHIARELHDEIGQSITALKLLLQMASSLPGPRAEANLREAQVLIDELMGRVGELSLDLRPAMLDDLGLLPALLWHFGRYTDQTGVRVTFRHTGLERRRLPTGIETAVYRIVQEALTNIARHAGVDEAAVQVWAGQDVLSVQIEDQGCGFRPEAALTAATSSGLQGMHERAVLLGGCLTLESAPGRGTRLTADLPLSGRLERRKNDRLDRPGR